MASSLRTTHHELRTHLGSSDTTGQIRSGDEQVLGENVMEAGSQQRERLRVRVIGLLLSMSLAGVGGCHTSWPFASSHLQVGNAQFMDAWRTYIHCRSSSEPDEIRADLQQLTSLAQAETVQNHAPRLLPAAVRSLIATLPSRLAVDPQSMAAACALHGGHMAQSAGRPDVSEELFNTVAGAQHESASAYYAVEASRRLRRMKEEMPVTWQRTQTPVQNSSE